MEQIPTKPTRMENAVTTITEQKKKVAKGLLNNAGILVGIFISFVVVIAVTTEINLNSFEAIAALGLNFFLLLFCSYSMYVSCSDSGMRAGLRTASFGETVKRHDELKRSIIEQNMLGRLLEFCVYYVREELKNTRLSILAFAGLSYNDYESKWLAKDKESVNASSELTEMQKCAIIKANKMHPIRLTPEMIMRRGAGEMQRSPIGKSPRAKKGTGYVVKLFTTICIVIATTLIELKPVVESSWVLFASCCLNLAVVIVNGFGGYRFGYENIVTDTVNYINDQSDMLERAIQYVADHPCT